MFLATTANQRFWKDDENILFLGEWCRIYDQKHVWSKLDHQVLPYHWEDREKLYKDLSYIDFLYEEYLKQLGEQLNQTHQVDHSPRYWRIIVGPWLYFFIMALYDRFCSIQKVIESSLVTNTWLPPLLPDHWGCDSVSTCSYRFYEDDSYNLYIFSKVIQKLKGIPFEIKNDLPHSKESIQSRSYTSMPYLKKAAQHILQLYIKFIPDHFNNIVFAGSFLSIGDLTRLQLSLRQMPYPMAPIIPLGQLPLNFNIRNDLRLPVADIEFESLLNEMIVEQIPTAYVEDYASMCQNSLKAFPGSPKAIVTATLYHNEGLKFWTAFHVEKGAKLAAVQHGGGYGHHRWSFFESHEKKISDKYLTWGWEAKGTPSIVPLASGKLTRFAGRVKSNPKGGILWVTTTAFRYTRILTSMPLATQLPDYIREQERFYQAVLEEVRELLMLRLYLQDYGWGRYKRWRNFAPTLKCYQGNQPIYRQLSKSRLCIVDYNGTTFLETFAANFPTLLFWDMSLNELRESAQPYFDDLRRVGIFHDTPESAAAKVNSIYKDPMSWWNSSDIQEVKDKFCHQFARTSKTWLKEWKEELLKIASK